MKNPRWFRLRGIFQLLFWFLFIWAVVYTRSPLERNPLADVYPRLSAHLGVSASITAGKLITSFWPALVILVFTMLFGRIFCSTICPLGATLDVTDRLFNKSRKITYINSKDRARSIKPFKYVLLAFSLIIAAAGIQAAGLFDPLSLAFRSYSTALYPYFDHLVKITVASLYKVPVINLVSEPLYAVFRKSVLDFNPILFLNHLWIFISFTGVLALSSFARRFWCQALCPLGAVLSLTGRFGALKRAVNTDKCVHCMKCVRDCRMSAIFNRGEDTLHGECIQCFECLHSCRYDAIEFKLTVPFIKSIRPNPTENNPAGGGLTRRHMVTGVVASLAAIPVLRLNPVYKSDHAGILRPPGALEEERFLDLCIRCGACMKVCPTNALHPSMSEAGIEALFTPRLIPRLGWCEKDCVLCTRVCPTGAIKKLEIPQKETTAIGTAYIIRDLCIPWAEGRNCIVCEEVCPTVTKSIKFREEYTIDKEGKKVLVKFPLVLENVCIGCGICENKCPVPGNAAIRVRIKKISAENTPAGKGAYG